MAASFLTSRLLRVYLYFFNDLLQPKAIFILINLIFLSLTSVAQGNEKITARPDNASVNEDEVLHGASVLADDTHSENAPLTAVLVEGPAYGTLKFNSDGTYTYTPAANFFGHDIFYYYAKDAANNESKHTKVNINVKSVNDAPVAIAQSLTTDENKPIAITLAGTDVDNDPLTYAIISGPAHGTISGTAPNLIYTPNTSYFGTDSFSFRVNDGTVNSAAVTVSISVNRLNKAPVAVADAYTVNEGAALSITAPGVLANDTDQEGDALTASVISNPLHGTLILNADGSFSYTHNGSETTADSFSYRASDGSQQSATTTVSITVTPLNDAPVALADAASVNEDEVLNGSSVLANDTDADSDILSAVLVDDVAHGSLTLNSNGTYTYTPAANYFGADSFSYKARDATGAESTTVKVSITVVAVNDPPVATAQSVTTIEDSDVAITLAGTDVDNSPLQFTVVSPPANGTFTSGTYTPNVNYYGPDSFTFTASDGELTSAPATVSITVTPVNDAPVATADAYTVNEGATITIAAPGILANDADVEGQALSALLVSTTTNGNLSLNADGSFSYIHNGSETSSDSFSYKVNDGAADGNTVTVSLTIIPVNDAPVATPQSVSTNEDTTLAIALSGIDAEGDALSYAVVSGPVHGSLAGTAPNLIYTPGTDFNGADSFSFRVSDGSINSNNATVSVTVQAVNDAPVAKADEAVTLEDTPVTVDVLANDTDVDGDVLIITNVNPVNGTAVVSAGKIVFTPDPDFFGTAGFSYIISDGNGATASASASIEILPVNDRPSFTKGADQTLPEDAGAQTVAGWATTILAGPANEVNQAINFSVSNDNNSLFAVQPSISSNGTLIYTPAPNAYGSAIVAVQLTDDGGTSNGGADKSTLQTFSITVTPVNDAPDGHDNSITMLEDTNVSFMAAHFGFSDLEGNSLSAVKITTIPTAGTLHFNGTAVSAGDEIAAANIANLKFTPAANASGAAYATFTFQVIDDGGTANGGVAQDQTPNTIIINVTAVNDAPVATAQAISTHEDVALAITLAGTDVENDPLNYAVVSGPVHGTLTGTAPNLTYTPDFDYHGADSFTFTVNDGALTSDIATVSVTIVPVNDAPVATADAYTINEGATLSPVAPGVLANDSDAESSSLSASLISTTTNGTLTLNADGSFTYIHNGSETTADSFSYKSNDGSLDSNTAIVSISITPVNDAPVANAQSVTTDEEVAVAITLTGTDAEGDELLYTVVVPPVHGTLSGTAPLLSYIPNTNYTGTDSFSFKTNDGSADSNQATIVITVTPVNDVPIAADQSVTTDEDVAVTITLSGTDVENSSLTFTIVTAPTHGTFMDGIYTPGANFHGSDLFTFTASDGELTSDAANVVITVTAVNDVPIAVADAATVNEDEVLNGSSVLANDTDADDANLSAVLVDDVAHGSLTLNSNGTYTYTPAADYFGTDSFTYKARDGAGAESNTVVVTITVAPVNDAPVATADAYTVNEGATLTIAAPGVLANDVDVEEQSLNAVLVSTTTNGTMTFNADGSFSYTHNGSKTTSDSFSYKANDGSVDSGITTVSITVNPILPNQAPIANNDNLVGRENEAVSGNVLTNDSDPENQVLTASTTLVENPANGSVVINSNGEFTYTPRQNFNGQDQFTYSVCDASAACSQAVVTISILPYDSDGDRIPDLVEYGADAQNPVDTDGDGTPDYLDADSDNDGIADEIEAGINPKTPVDSDKDTLPDYVDLDSDGDGKLDAEEGTEDCDADGKPNYLDNEDPCLEKILISQAISPNGDRNNDFWKIFLIENFPANKIQIFNRWGALVFAMDGYNNEDKVWSGESNRGAAIGDGRLTDGTYFYHINLGDGSKTYTGYVVIKR